MHGWAPATVQAITVLALGAAIGARSRHWRERWLPVTTVLGVALAIGAHGYIGQMGIAGDPAPRALWIWLALTSPAVATLLSAGACARWSQRGASMLAVPLCVMSAGLELNSWVEYFPTVHTAWNQLTAGPLPNQTDRITVTAMRESRGDPQRHVPASPMAAVNFLKAAENPFRPRTFRRCKT